ncbi:uncharacterized protein LOC144557251 [Carex rostrata]
MQERGRVKGGYQIESNNLYDRITYKSNELKITTSSSSTSSPSSSFSSSSSSPSNGFNYIRHEVCKMDTLAGIAIKYGVEIADVKRLNGLATDHQMFAHKTLRIPFQGRHPTIYQEISRDATEVCTEHRREIIDGLESLKLKSPPHHQKTCLAIGPLHGHYGLPPIVKRKDAKHKPSKSFCLGNEDLLLIGEATPKQHRRSRSLLTGEMTGENGNSKILNRQHQKPNASPEGSSGTGTVPTIASLLVDKLLTIRKSSSTSNLQDFDIASSYSLFVATSKWNLLPETFALPSFDGFRNPIASWRTKSAQD